MSEEKNKEKTGQGKAESDDDRYVREHKRNRAIEERVKLKIAELLKENNM